MFKKIAAIGLGAALVLSPLAALAQAPAPAAGTEGAAPAAGAMPEKAPMKSTKMHHHKKHMAKKPMAPAAPAEAPKS